MCQNATEPVMNSATIKQVFASNITLLVAGVFVFSAITKLMPIEAFEVSLVDIGFANFTLAPIMARLLIGLEFVIAFLLIFHYKLRRVTIPIAAALLVLFTIYIGYLLKVYGNRGSCGCFGTVVQFTPLEGLIKNVVLLLMLGISFLWAPAMEFKQKSFIAAFGTVMLMIVPFVVNPMGNPFKVTPLSEYKRFPIDTATLYHNTVEPRIAATDITKGKHVVAFLSSTCEHCRLAAKKLMVFKKQMPSLPMVFVLYNNTEKLPEFYAETKSDSIPRILLTQKEDFLSLTQSIYPRIYWVDNGTVVYENNFYELDLAAMQLWLK